MFVKRVAWGSFFCFGSTTRACGVLVPPPGVKPAPLQSRLRVLTSGPPGKALEASFWWWNSWFVYIFIPVIKFHRNFIKIPPPPNKAKPKASEIWIRPACILVTSIGLPEWFNCRRHKRYRFDPWVGKIPWCRKWQPPSVFLPGKPLRQRSLVGYSPEGCKELDTTGQLSTCTVFQSHLTVLLWLRKMLPLGEPGWRALGTLY